MRPRQFLSALTLLVYALALPARAYADPVPIRNVTQVFTTAQDAPDLRLSTVYDSELPVSALSLSPVGRSDSRQHAATDLESLMSGVSFYPLDQSQDPRKAPTADVEVAICDCGEVVVPVAGGFPKWPLLFLAGIPLFFLKGGEEELPPIFTPTPSLTPTTQGQPPQTPVPEPTSLVLLLSGICAVGFRLRKRLHRNND